MSFLAIDPGTHTIGWALFNDEDEVKNAGSVHTEKKEVFDRCEDLIEQLKGTLFSTSVKLFVCEEPMMQGRPSQMMHKLLGRLEQALGKLYYVYPSTVKKLVGGHGKSDKLEVALGAGNLLLKEEEHELMARLIQMEEFDATDAIAIGLTYLIQQGKRSPYVMGDPPRDEVKV